jgi:hypothetical protein
MGRVNQAQSEQREALLNRPTYQQVVEGFNKGGGTTSPSAPTILRVVSQGRMISISWDKQYNLTNLSHYVVQVSEDRENWYSLGTWAGDLNAVTTTYEQGIIHANIPHKDSGSVRTLYYRVAAVTYAEQQSDWSEIVSGSTKWLYVDVDYKTGGDYIYDCSGFILTSGLPYILGPYDYEYVASGSGITSGQAGLNVLDYYYSYNTSGFTLANGTGDDICYVTHDPYSGTGVVNSSGSAGLDWYRLAYRIVYDGEDIGSITFVDVIDSEGIVGSKAITHGASFYHYGPPTSQMLAIASAGNISLNGPYQA